MVYQERAYKNYIKASDLKRFEVIEKETDLLILAENNLYDKALGLLLKYRGEIEKYIKENPRFSKSYSPLWSRFNAPPIIKEMIRGSRKAKVGPMASVAGTIAEFVGRALLEFSEEIIVENGGDLFINIKQTRKFEVNAQLAIEVEPQARPFSICTSSGTSGNSFSFGQADSVVVISQRAALADAAATAIGNIVKEVTDIDHAMKKARKIRGLDGVLIIKDDQVGILGKVNLVPLK